MRFSALLVSSTFRTTPLETNPSTGMLAAARILMPSYVFIPTVPEILDELISMAGDFESLCISDHIAFGSDDDFEDELDDDFEDDFDTNADNIIVANTNRPRKGMRIWSKICLGWSVLCFILFIGGVISGESTLVTVGIGEGLFVLVLGLMFSALSKTEKGNPYMTLCGKTIKKWVFVILCIVIAYVFFIGAMGVTGGLNVTTS